MAFKNPQRIAVAVVILGLLASIYYFGSSKPEQSQNPNTPAPQSQSQEESEDDMEQQESDLENTWEGVLKLSDNSKKGNLMLVMGKQVIYINTSRDYSSLLEKEVRVIYDGTLENFRLGDIISK